jgi:hypothetical protein
MQKGDKNGGDFNYQGKSQKNEFDSWFLRFTTFGNEKEKNALRMDCKYKKN